MKVKGNHPLGELLAAKLFSIETVPPKEQRRMVSRAIKAAIAWHEASINEPCNTQMQIDTKAPCEYCKGWTKIGKSSFCERCGRPLSA